MYSALIPDSQVTEVKPPWTNSSILLYQNEVTGQIVQFAEFKVRNGRIDEIGTGYVTNFMTGETHEAEFPLPAPPAWLVGNSVDIPAYASSEPPAANRGSLYTSGAIGLLMWLLIIAGLIWLLAG